MEKKENYFLNCLKGIACIGVVFIHVAFPGLFGKYIYTIASAGVPLFFLISGYYAMNQEKNMVRIFNKIKHIGKMSLIVSIIYIIWKFIKVFIQDTGIENFIQDFSLKSWIKFIVFNDTIFMNCGHVWFLYALLYCYLLLYILVFFKKENYIYPFIIISFIGRITIMTLCKNWHYSENFWLDGFPYFFAGMYFRKNQNMIYKIPNKVLVFIMLIAMLLSQMENIVNIRIKIFEIGTILFAVTVFIFAQKHPVAGKSSIIGFIGKYLSMYVYIIHVIIFELIDILESKIFMKLPLWYEWMEPIIVAVLAVGASYCIYLCKRKIEKLSWQSKVDNGENIQRLN